MMKGGGGLLSINRRWVSFRTTGGLRFVKGSLVAATITSFVKGHLIGPLAWKREREREGKGSVGVMLQCWLVELVQRDNVTKERRGGYQKLIRE
jgi:hypothetical protein